ncbi:hypothetical protein D3C84_1138930 [compost metagenome]
MLCPHMHRIIMLDRKYITSVRHLPRKLLPSDAASNGFDYDSSLLFKLTHSGGFK